MAIQVFRARKRYDAATRAALCRPRCLVVAPPALSHHTRADQGSTGRLFVSRQLLRHLVQRLEETPLARPSPKPMVSHTSQEALSLCHALFPPCETCHCPRLLNLLLWLSPSGIGSDSTIRWGLLKAKVQPPPDKVWQSSHLHISACAADCHGGRASEAFLVAYAFSGFSNMFSASTCVSLQRRMSFYAHAWYTGTQQHPQKVLSLQNGREQTWQQYRRATEKNRQQLRYSGQCA